MSPGKRSQLDTTIMLETFLNSTDECIVIIDKEGFIKVLSKAYAEFLQVDRDNVIGKHVTEVIENTRMHIVLKTGVSEIAEKQVIRGESMIASRFPIIKNGEIIGAFGRVLFKNINDLNDLYEQINNIEEELTLYKKTLTDQHQPKYSLDDIITANPEMMRLKNMVSRVARTSSSVLLLGESGTGKELFAHSIHSASKRAKKPFVSLNCGAIPQELLESELFGYESGAFTGASRKGKIGLFKVADGGTILLDEIGELPVHLQVKLLRFLQEKEIKRVGSTTNEKVDVRIITATNSNLADMMKAGKFRSDAYYRLSVVTLNIPPLRERREDIRVLANHLIQKICRKENIRDIRISEEALQCMQQYDWPGNVRELENVLESAINFIGSENMINPDKLPARLTCQSILKSKRGESSLEQADLKQALDTFEKDFIMKVLGHSNYNKTKASKLLGTSRTSLYEKIKKYGLE